ncbi:MAG: AI-2E family transporter [Methylacidiphilales bacterium]|nr:AI-2E family transporter [Candidatus Methylacidiphilales bacterium]
MDTPKEPTPPPAPNDAEACPTLHQRQLLWTSLVALAVTALLGVGALVFLGFITFLSWSYPILLPMGLAVIVALVLDPVVTFLQKRGMRRGAATILVCLLAVAGFLFFWAYLLPPLWQQASAFFVSLPASVSAGAKSLRDSFQGQPVAQAWLDANLPGLIQEVSQNVAKFMYASLAPVGHAFGFVLGFGFVPIYVYYFLADQDRISTHWKEYVPLRRAWLRDEVVSVIAEINQVLVNYFRGQIIVAICNGVLMIIGLTLIGVPYSLVLGLVAGALSIVPFLGIIMSILPALLLAFLAPQNDSTWQWLRPVLVLVVFSVVQMCESMFITPRVQSHSTGLHPLAIIVGILFWSMLLPGLLGPIVAVPLTCAMVVLLRRYVWQEREN